MEADLARGRGPGRRAVVDGQRNAISPRLEAFDQALDVRLVAGLVSAHHVGVDAGLHSRRIAS